MKDGGGKGTKHYYYNNNNNNNNNSGRDGGQINAWSKSYHLSSREMVELLFGEMMQEWRFGRSVVVEGMMEREGDGDVMVDGTLPSQEEAEGNDDNNEEVPKKVGNGRDKPDVVTFTAVINAWVKCTALAHYYHY